MTDAWRCEFYQIKKIWGTQKILSTAEVWQSVVLTEPKGLCQARHGSRDFPSVFLTLPSVFATTHIAIKRKKKMLKCLCTRSRSKGTLKTTLLSCPSEGLRSVWSLAPRKDSPGRLAPGLRSAAFFALTHGLGSHISSKLTNFEFWCVSEISLVINYQRIPLSLQQWCDDLPALCHWLEDFALRHYSCFSSQLSVPLQTVNDSARGWSCLHRIGTQHFLPPSIKIL